MRHPRASAFILLGALALACVSAAGCDSSPATCSDGQIQIVNLAAGAGTVANDSSRVRLTYTATLDDGRQVASEANVTVSLDETEPIGFRQGVAGMRENGRRRFILPPSLGFGPDGGPVGIPSCARLTFNVELHEVLPAGCSNTAPTVTIEDSEIGTGAEAQSTSRVVVNSTLSLFNGTIVEERSNAQLNLGDGSHILGIPRGIAGMLEGGRRRVFIPPNLGYGLAGIPGTVPSCSSLIYDVELVTVLP